MKLVERDTKHGMWKLFEKSQEFFYYFSAMAQMNEHINLIKLDKSEVDRFLNEGRPYLLELFERFSREVDKNHPANNTCQHIRDIDDEVLKQKFLDCSNEDYRKRNGEN